MKLGKLIVLLVLLIIILQGIEVKDMGMSFKGASPFNNEWDGTSSFTEILRSIGAKVIEVTDWFQMLFSKDFDSYRCRILYIISPEKKFSIISLAIIKYLVEEKNFTIVIADEGPYSNTILQTLNIPIEIRSEVQYRERILTTYINMDNVSIPIVFVYASPLHIKDETLCKPIAVSRNGTILAAICTQNGKVKAVVFGDGSIFTNAALEAVSELNPHVALVLELMKGICRNNRALVLVDASSYVYRPIPIEKLMKEGISYDYILTILVNPSRYLYAPIQYFNEILLNSKSITFLMVLIITIVIHKSILQRFATLKVKRREKCRIDKRSLMLIIKLCNEQRISDKFCKEIVELISRKKTRSAIAKIEKLIHESEDFRRELVQALSS